MSDSNEKSKPKDIKKLIQCKNCRQDILAEKMFLHEGFCNRNNVFCDHCQKVFLKKDYEKHLKSVTTKKSMKHLKTPERPKRREKEAKIQTINIYTSPIITKRKTTFEYIEMPMTEQYKVNNPIIISENGQIVSNQNNNEYLLPYFGINSPKSNEKKSAVDDIIINQDEYYEEKPPIIMNENELNLNQYIETSLRNSLSMNNLNNEYNNFNTTQNIEANVDKINSKLNIIELTDNKDFFNNKNGLIRSHSSNMLLNNINLKNDGMNQNFNNINNDFVQNNSDTKKINNENNNKNNNIIINNNIITYNANNNINKIHNFFNADEKNQKSKKNPDINNIRNSLMNNNIFQDISSTKFNPLRISKKNDIIKFKKNLEKNIKINLSKKNTKEPNDSGTKSKPRDNKITTYVLERSPQNSTNKKSSNKKNQIQTEKKRKKSKKICEFCDSEVDDLVMHYKIYHYKMSREILKPQKRDTVLLNEKLNSDNTDEFGIEESNKRLLSRQIKPNINWIGNNSTKNFITSKNSQNYKTAEKMRLKLPKFKSPENIKKVKKINLNNNINFAETTEKKNFPEDNIRGSLLAKTQAREYERKVIYIGDNILQSANRNTKKRMVINTADINNKEIAYGKNGQISPIYLFTDSKKNDFFERREYARSPVVQKINFLKTVFDDIENY